MCGNILAKRKYCRSLVLPLINNSILFKHDRATYIPKGSFRSLFLFSLAKINTYLGRKTYWFSCQNDLLHVHQKKNVIDCNRPMRQRRWQSWLHYQIFLSNYQFILYSQRSIHLSSWHPLHWIILKKKYLRISKSFKNFQ